MLHIFFSASLDKVSWRPNVNRTWCPDDTKKKKKKRHQTCRIQKAWLWTKHQKLKFTWLITSSGMTKEWFLTMKWYSILLYSLKSIIRFAPAPWLLNSAPKHGVPAVQTHKSTCLHSALTWGLNLVRKQYQAFPWHHKNKATRTLFWSDKGPDKGCNNQSFGF